MIEQDVSIIIVNYNSEVYLKKCLDSIIGSKCLLNLEIIVVDNASTDGSVIIIKEKYPFVKVISNDENKGFAFANNQAINLSRGKFIMFLNPDTIVLERSIENMFSFMQKNEDIGIVGPMVVNADDTFQPQCKRGFPTPLSVLSYFLGLHKIFPKSKISGKYLLTYLDKSDVNEVDSVSGACMLVRKHVLQEVGLLDEDYFMFGEDLDLCYRVKQKGWKIYYFPYSKIIHYGGQGGTYSHPFKTTFYFFKSAHIFYKKNLSHKYNFLYSSVIYFGIWTLFLLILFRNFIFRKRYVFTKKTS